MRHILLINLGKGSPEKPPLGYDRTSYRFEDGFEVETCVAGLALWKRLEHTGRAPCSVRFAVTREAWEGKEGPLREEAAALGLDEEVLGEPLFLEIPATVEALWAVLPELESWVENHKPRNGDTSSPILHLDLTHAWRAIPITQPWLALFLERLDLVTIGTMGYGAYVRGQSPTPYLDLSAVMVLAEWAAGVREFERYGRAGTLARAMEAVEGDWTQRVFKAGSDADKKQALGKLRSVLRAAAAIEEYLPAGLPVELGIEARSALGESTAEETAAGVGEIIPGVEPLALRLHKAATRFAWRERVPQKGEKAERVSLSEQELERQLELIEYWASIGAVGEALRALRELLVNRLLLAMGRRKDWLLHEARKEAQDRLNAFRPGARAAGCSELPSESQEVVGLWGEICNSRNVFAHAGMCPEFVKVSERKKALRGLLERSRRVVASQEAWEALARVEPGVGSVE